MAHKIAAVWWLYELQSWLVIIDDRYSFNISRLSTAALLYFMSHLRRAHVSVWVGNLCGSHLKKKESFYLLNSNGHFFSMFHLKRILRSIAVSHFRRFVICFVFIRTSLPLLKRARARSPTREITIVESLAFGLDTLTRLQRCAAMV